MQDRRTIHPFVEYLSNINVFTRLQKNCAHYMAEDEMSISYVSRIFNDLPDEYEQFRLLLEHLLEATNNNELELWFDFATFVGMTDLCDNLGALHNDIYTILNDHKSAAGFGTIERLLQAYSSEKINANLLAAYIILLSEKALLHINNKCPIPDTCIDTERADFKFSQLLNQKCKGMDKLDVFAIKTLRNRLLKEIDNPEGKSKKFASCHQRILLPTSGFNSW